MALKDLQIPALEEIRALNLDFAVVKLLENRLKVSMLCLFMNHPVKSEVKSTWDRFWRRY